jgi:hypothetical protein
MVRALGIVKDGATPECVVGASSVTATSDHTQTTRPSLGTCMKRELQDALWASSVFLPRNRSGVSGWKRSPADARSDGSFEYILALTSSV